VTEGVSDTMRCGLAATAVRARPNMAATPNSATTAPTHDFRCARTSRTLTDRVRARKWGLLHQRAAVD